MSMSDCEKCWDTPCTCGHDYEGWSVERLEAQIQMLQRVRFQKLCPPTLVKAEELERGSGITVLGFSDAKQCMWTTRTKGKP
jgi:hypothetical protein